MTNKTYGKQKKVRNALFFITILTAAFIITVQKLQAEGTNYYVGGTAASDSNPGTGSQPFATIQKAAIIAVAGDVVNIRAGIYRETISPTNSGLPGNPIIFQPDGDAIVTISGTEVTDGNWKLHNSNIYKKTISMTNGYNAKMTDNTTLMANQVFVGGKMMIEARWPNLANSEDLLNRNDFRSATTGTWSTSSSQTLNDPNIPNIDGGWTGGTIWVNGWYISQTRDITAHSGTQITLSGSIIIANKREYYYLTGKLGALDAEKEFFYDGTYLYLWQPGGGSPTNVEVKKRNYAFDLSDKSYITIRKINLFASTITSNSNSTNITLDGIKAKYINHNVTVNEPDVIYSHTGQVDTAPGSAGIRLVGANSIIEDSEVSFSSNMGIMLGTNCTANNNLVHDIAYDGSYASAIAPHNGTNGQTITNNTIYRTGRSCIDLMNSQNVNIGYNDLYHFGMINIDLGATYAARGSNTTGLRIHHNWIHDHKSIADGTGTQTGVYFDQNSGSAQIDHNMIYFPDGGARTGDIYVQHYASPNPEFQHKIYNNTLASTNVTYSYKNANHAPASHIFDRMANNIFRDEFQITYVPHTPEGTNSLYMMANIRFAGTGKGGLQYRLQSTSPAKDTGVVVEGITDGYVGSAPDVGAYEYGGSDWVPGYKAVESIPTSLSEEKIKPGFKAYPNPATGELFVEMYQKENKGYNLKLLSSKGELVKTALVDDEMKLCRLDISKVTSGVYILQLISVSGRKYAEEVIIKN